MGFNEINIDNLTLTLFKKNCKNYSLKLQSQSNTKIHYLNSLMLLIRPSNYITYMTT